jgi:hypothetical protein
MPRMKDKRFQPYEPDQSLLLPPNMNDWLPAKLAEDRAGHVRVGALPRAGCGPAPGPPEGRALRGDTICAFRKRHLAALSDLFVQVLDICREAGLGKLGHVALDARWSGPSGVRTCRGTKVLANASKHKAMSYGRMPGALARPTEVRRLPAPGRRHAPSSRPRWPNSWRGPRPSTRKRTRSSATGVRGDEIPEELRFREKRLAKIEEAMAA